MIVKRNFSPLKVWSYIKNQMLFVIAWSTAVWLLFYFAQARMLAISFTPIGVLGSALAIFVAFRNNSAYARWWEASTLWNGILNSSRVFARLTITFADSHSHQPQYTKERSDAFKKSLIYKQIAWVNALRLHLRNQDAYEELEFFFNWEDHQEIISKNHKPNAILLLMGQEIYKAMANGTLGGFDSFQMEGQLQALTSYMGGAEKIKYTPLPRQYDFFTRVFVVLFGLLLPFGMLSLFNSPEASVLSLLIIPLSIMISGVFIIMERTGAAIEDPFENNVTDVSLSHICNMIERDLRELLGETVIPDALKPENGYLF